MNDAITPFTLAIPQTDLEDLNRRIDQTRWPDAETVDDWTQGAPLAKVKALVDAAVLKVSAGGFPASPEWQNSRRTERSSSISSVSKKGSDHETARQ